MHRTLPFALLLAAFPTLTHAQRTTVRGGEFRNQTVVDDTLNRKGRFELALNLAGAMSFGSVTPDGGERVSQSNLYLTASLVGGIMVHDNIELRLTAGTQYIAQSTGEDQSIRSPAFVGAIQALYQRDLVLGLGIYVGLGAGGFYGTRNEEVAAGLARSFTSVGGLAQALLGLMMMPGPRLVLRGGVRADFLIGSESPDDGAGADSSFFTTQVLFDVSLGLRFG
ncbi:MAG: hypothetical protein AAGE52_43105 [Myxococcota bacterium]